MVESVVLSAVVMAHPRRRRAAEELCARYPELALRMVLDPDPTGPPSALRTARLAWRSVDPGATHLLVVQDDMRLAEGFAERVRRAAAAMPGQILCFFVEWGSRTANALRLATIEGAGWVPVLDPYVPTTALLLPAQMARELADHPEEPGTVADDVVLLRYAEKCGRTPYVSCPNLAEHQVSDSLVGNDILMGPRYSAYFAGASAGAPGPASSRVSRLVCVPHLAMFEGIAIQHVRPSPASADWRVVKAHEYLAPSGATVSDLLSWYGETISDVDARHRMRDVVGDSMLFQFWLNAFGYGVAAAGLVAGEDEFAAALGRPEVVAAMGTLPAGSLRRFVPRRYLPGLAGLLHPLMDSAVHKGYIHGRLYGEFLWKQSFQ